MPDRLHRTAYTYDHAFRLMILRLVEDSGSLSSVARAYNVRPGTVYAWRARYGSEIRGDDFSALIYGWSRQIEAVKADSYRLRVLLERLKIPIPV